MKKMFLISALVFSVIFQSAENAAANEIYLDKIEQENAAFTSNISSFSPDEAVTEKKTRTEKNRFKKSSSKEKNVTEPISDVNTNLLLPTLTPGQSGVGDINRTRQYYNLMHLFGTKEKPVDYESPVIEEEIKLPERTIDDNNTIKINNITFSESKIFTDEEIEKFKNLVKDKDVTAEDINNYVSLINTQYLKKNCITAKAYIPAAELKGGTLHVELLEARIGKIIVENNKFNRTFFLKTRLSQKEGDVLNMMALEKDLRKFNMNARGAKLTARLRAGEAYGTTDIILTPEENFPLHLSGSWDNFGRTATGLKRGGIVASTDSVFGIQDRFTGAINLSRSTVTPYVDYNIPVNKAGTRVGASYMYGNAEVTRGDYRSWDIKSKTHVFSLYATHPLFQNERLNVNAITSVNRKMSSSDIKDFTYTKLNSTNLATGLNASYRFDTGYLYTSHIATNGIIQDKMLNHENYFVKYNGDIFGIKYFKNGIALTGKVSGQYSPNNIPFIEQSQIGGMSTVRGYSESLMLGPSSYVASLELLLPIPFLPNELKIPFTKDRETKKPLTYALRDNIRFATFVDNGAAFKFDQKVQNHDFLTSTGFGLRVAMSKYLTARFYWGFGLGTREIDQKTGRFHFDLISTPF